VVLIAAQLPFVPDGADYLDNHCPAL
jgi:hypothetical protein